MFSINCFFLQLYYDITILCILFLCFLVLVNKDWEEIQVYVLQPF